ncbi:MAG TPA: GNAT family N-acetyltransferase [Aggregatilineaceae bacterium]|nr:GNAT family N-acetyltransferase [Aggregatilineaceae bacterium]
MDKVEQRWQPRSVMPDDMEAMSAFLKTFDDAGSMSLIRSLEPKYYAWKLFHNPRRNGLAWLAIDKEDTNAIVGTTTLVPKYLWCNQAEHLVAEIGDTFTSPAFQRQGIFSSLVKRTCANASELDIQLIYGTPNDQSLFGYEKKLNFKQIPNRVTRLMFPTLPKQATLALLGNRVYRRIPGFLFLNLYRSWYMRSRHAPDIKVQEVTEFPPDVTNLYIRSREEFDVMIVRDQTHLTWRYVQNPDEYRILLASDNTRLRGYAVWKQAPWHGQPVCHLVDYLVLPDDQRAYDALITHIIQQATAEKLALVNLWTMQDSPYYHWLRQRGFLSIRHIPVIVYCAAPLAKQLLEQLNRWHFTMADADVI